MSMDILSNVQFPLTLDAFCAVQEELAGEPTTDRQREVYEICVGVINMDYELGLSGGNWEQFDVNAQLAQIGAQGSPMLRSLLQSLNVWGKLAYLRGKEKRNGLHVV